MAAAAAGADAEFVRQIGAWADEMKAYATTRARMVDSTAAPQSGGELRDEIRWTLARRIGSSASACTDDVLALAAVQQLVGAQAAVQRVRHLHRPIQRGAGPECRACLAHATFARWPCETIRTLEGAAIATIRPRSGGQVQAGTSGPQDVNGPQKANEGESIQ